MTIMDDDGTKPMTPQLAPVYGTFKELRPLGMDARCTCCERDLSGHALRWLELDQRTQTYHDLRDVPEDRSQGWFPFGLTCAKKLVKQEAARRAALKTAKGEK